MTTTEPTWIAAGATVAVTSSGLYGTPEFVQIDKVTATQIVLVDGRRFQRTGSHKQLQVGSGQLRASLADPKSPMVLRSYARALLRQVAREADQMVRGAGATINDMQPADVREALGQLADKINEARKELDRRTGL